MGEIKAAETTHQTHHHRLIIAGSDNPTQQKHRKTQRIASLDIFRGLTVAVCIPEINYLFIFHFLFLAASKLS